MNKNPSTRFATWLILVLLAAATTAAAQSSGYHLLKRITLGGEGGWDYLTIDAQARRLYISRSTRVMVVDADSGAAVGEIPDTPGVHGIALAPEFGRGFTSNGRAATVTIFGLKTLSKLGEAKTGANPDAIVYDPASKRVFTFNGASKDATAINAATGEVIGTVPLEGKPEFAVADGAGHIYVNLEDKNELVALDSQKLAVLHRWPLKGCEEPSGLALDAKNRRLYSGCSNRVMAVVDADTGRIVATLPIGAGVDATAYDADAHLAFSSNGDGTLTVIRAESPEKYSVLGNVATQRGARTLALDPKTHNIYLVTADFGPAPAPTPENPRPRRTLVPGSFVLLVFGK